MLSFSGPLGPIPQGEPVTARHTDGRHLALAASCRALRAALRRESGWLTATVWVATARSVGAGRLLGVDEEDDGEGDERRQGRQCDQCKSEPIAAAPLGDGDCTLERADEVGIEMNDSTDSTLTRAPPPLSRRIGAKARATRIEPK